MERWWPGGLSTSSAWKDEFTKDEFKAPTLPRFVVRILCFSSFFFDFSGLSTDVTEGFEPRREKAGDFFFFFDIVAFSLGPLKE